MRPLDDTFADRVRETSLGVGGFVFLFLLAQSDFAVPINFALGLGASLLVWRSAQVVGGALEPRRWRARDVAPLAAIHLGKYGLIALVLWLLVRADQLRPLAFTGGFVIPTIVVGLKAVGTLLLDPAADPAPIYSRDRKAAPRG